MSGRRILLPLDSVSLSAAMVDALLKKGSGDAALLCLYLLRHDGYYESEEAGRVLGWDELRLDNALKHLSELGFQTGAPAPVLTPELPTRENAPNYTREDITDMISDKHSNFSYLLEDIQRSLGRPLSDREIRMLLEIVDHIQLPDEVIPMLVRWVCEEYSRKNSMRLSKTGQNNPGQSNAGRPNMSAILSAAYQWKKSGVDSLEAADAYLKKLSYFRTQEGELLGAVGIQGREAVDSERRFLRQWIDWGFSPESVAMAYEKTVFGAGKFKWSYCNSILRRWHEAGLHSSEEIRAKDQPGTRPGTRKVSSGPAPAPTLTAAQQEARNRALEENHQELKRLLASVGLSED